MIENQPDPLTQEYRYCSYADPSGGFRTLFTNDDHIQAVVTRSTLDGVALPYILYDTSTAVDNPACGGPQSTEGSSTVYAVNATSGKTETLVRGAAGAVTAAALSSPGVAAWILTSDQCFFNRPNPQRTETLRSFSFRTGTVTTLDTGDPGELTTSPRSLGNLQLYQCGAGCAANTAVVAWTHDGTWRYEQVG